MAFIVCVSFIPIQPIFRANYTNFSVIFQLIECACEEEISVELNPTQFLTKRGGTLFDMTTRKQRYSEGVRADQRGDTGESGVTHAAHVPRHSVHPCRHNAFTEQGTRLSSATFARSV